MRVTHFLVIVSREPATVDGVRLEEFMASTKFAGGPIRADGESYWLDMQHALLSYRDGGEHTGFIYVLQED
jgi:hypothetical protein